MCNVKMDVLTNALNKLDYGSGTIPAGVPSSLPFGVGGESNSNFLASAVGGGCFTLELILRPSARIQTKALSTWFLPWT